MEDYTVIIDQNRTAFETQVLKWSERGYIPQGGVSITAVNDTIVYYQAMIKPKQQEA